MTSILTPLLSEDDQDQVALLSELLINAKSRESLAKANRIELEDKLISIVGTKTEGSSSVESHNYKITTTAKMTRSIDQREAARLREKYGRELFELLPVRYTVSTTKLRVLNEMLSAGGQGARAAFPYADELLGAITTKPAKTAVKITELEA